MFIKMFLCDIFLFLILCLKLFNTISNVNNLFYIYFLLKFILQYFIQKVFLGHKLMSYLTFVDVKITCIFEQ
jgi:hypothetical protein